MALKDDILALPTTVGEGTTGHLGNHGIIHAGLKDHETRLGNAETNIAARATTATLDARVPSALALRVDTTVGTRIFAGDTMVYGDTGWRNLESLKAVPEMIVRTAQIRRNLDTVSWVFDIGIPAGVSISTLFLGVPNAFLPTDWRYVPPGYVSTTASTSAGASEMAADGARAWLVASNAGTSSSPATGQYAWCTGIGTRWSGPLTVQWSGSLSINRPWPTTLPGIPA